MPSSCSLNKLQIAAKIEHQAWQASLWNELEPKLFRDQHCKEVGLIVAIKMVVALVVCRLCPHM